MFQPLSGRNQLKGTNIWEGFDSKNLEVVLSKNFDSKKKYGHVFYSKKFFGLVGDLKNVGDMYSTVLKSVLVCDKQWRDKGHF